MKRMSLAAVFVAVLLAGAGDAQEAAEPTWRVAKRLEGGVFDHAVGVAARGEWLAAVQEFPERVVRPKAQRLDIPWKLVRKGKGEIEELASSETAHSGWGTPQWVAMGSDGKVTATWRRAHEVLLAAPGKVATRIAVPAGDDVECAGLTPDWLFTWNRKSHQLAIHALGAETAAERRPLPGGGPDQPTELRWDERWVAWVEEGDTLRWSDLSNPEAEHELAIATPGNLILSGVFGGHALLHERWGNERIHAVDFASGTLVSRSAPGAITALAPEGIFVDGWLCDPAALTMERWERTPPAWERVVRPRPGVLLVHDEHEWFELALGAPQAPIPEASRGSRAPLFLELEPEPAAERMARAWRAMRERDSR